MTVRVFGPGHPDRGDDAVGLLVADDLAWRALPGVEVRRVAGSPLELLGSWDHMDEVIVIDAVRGAAAPGVIGCFDAIAGPLPAGGSTVARTTRPWSTPSSSRVPSSACRHDW